MITRLDIVCAQGSDCYELGLCGVREIEESIYSVCGDPYPCYLIELENGTQIEVRTVHLCNVHKKIKETER